MEKFVTDDITPHVAGGSPFDAGRTPCPQGGEDRWSARWLMEQMSYDKWQNFEQVIERAKIAAHNQGFNVRTLFTASSKKGAGRPQTDYQLTRFAAYLVAMNGDPRKREVAAAQAYFAVKTHQAEVAEVKTLTPLEYARKLVDAEERVEVEQAKNRALSARIEKDAPLVAKAEAHSGSDSSVHRQEFAREVITWGLRQRNITIKQEHVMRFLGHIGLFIRGERTDTGHATADALKRGLAFTDKGTAKNGHAWATGKLTARGQDYAWRRITKYVEDNGTLELPRQLRGGDPA
ncbi:antirepressor [Gordonia phage Confidence]|nr:antirepressor [Gordonia phage Confidence]